MEFISKDTPYGIALALSGIALLAFGALTFLGLDYRFEGNLYVVVPMMLAGAAVVIWALVKMCKMKQTLRVREGAVKEIAFALLVLAVLGCASVPFTNFLHVLDHQDEFQAGVDSTVIVVKGIDEAYKTYANERVNNYRNHLRSLWTGSSAYRTELEGAAGNTKEEKIASLTNSLQRRLLSINTEDVAKARNQWLESLHSISVWNILTPRNIAAVGNAGNEWVEQYRKVSEMIYVGENAEPFAMPQLENKLSSTIASFTRFHRPDLRGIFAALFCFVFIMIPYFQTRRNTKGKRGTHQD